MRNDKDDKEYKRACVASLKKINVPWRNKERATVAVERKGSAESPGMGRDGAKLITNYWKANEWKIDARRGTEDPRTPATVSQRKRFYKQAKANGRQNRGKIAGRSDCNGEWLFTRNLRSNVRALSKNRTKNIFIFNIVQYWHSCDNIFHAFFSDLQLRTK